MDSFFLEKISSKYSVIICLFLSLHFTQILFSQNIRYESGAIITTTSKVYDASDIAHVTVSGDTLGIDPLYPDVQLNVAARYDNRNSGKRKDIILSFSLTGTDAVHYIAPSDSVLHECVILPRQTTMSDPIPTLRKEYDGYRNAILLSGTLQDTLGGDDVYLVLESALYDSENCGVNKPIEYSFKLEGDDSFNYIAPVAGILNGGEIYPRQLQLKNPKLDAIKIYDGTLGVKNLKAGEPMNLVLGDSIEVDVFAHYENKNVGQAKIIYLNYQMKGRVSDLPNYITPKSIKIDNGEIKPRRVVAQYPKLRTSKLYDSNDSASVVPGAIMQDKVQNDSILLYATAKYEDKNVGVNKLIEVSYTIAAGPNTDVNNYLPPANYLAYDGEILPLQLVATISSVDTIKYFDTYTTARIIKFADLNGVIAGDIVSHTEYAHYSSPEVGRNKNITVKYELGGIDAKNYVPPVDYIVENGIIIERIILNPANGVTINNVGFCSGDLPSIECNLISGRPTHYSIVFGDMAINEGFYDINDVSIDFDDYKFDLPIALPRNCMPGTYSAAISFKDEMKNVSQPAVFSFKVNLSDTVLVPMWNDVVAVNLNAVEFNNFQWYRDDLLIEGATMSYYCEKGGLNGNYAVEIIRPDGEKILSCPAFFDLRNHENKPSLVSSPMPATANQTFNLHITDAELVSLNDAILQIVTLQGVVVYRSTSIAVNNELSLPQGLYLATLILPDGSTVNEKIIVK